MPYQSPYTMMDANPIRFTDVLGDTVRGLNNLSGTRLRDAVRKSFPGEAAAGLRSLIRLDSDGKSLSSINESDFAKSVTGLSEDQQQLAYGYFKAINGKDLHLVEMATREEKLSKYAIRIFGYYTGEEADVLSGGGVNYGINTTTTYSVIIMNSKHPIPLMTASGFYVVSNSSSSELLAHEVLGHGEGYVKGSLTFKHRDAIQMTNLFLRAQGINNYRDGSFHKKNGELDSQTANGIPNFIKMSISLQMRIRLLSPKPLNINPAVRDNTRVNTKSR